MSSIHAPKPQVSKRCVEVWKVAKKALRWNVLFLFDTHAVLFTVCILGASSYETCRVNDTASILVPKTPKNGHLGQIYFAIFINFFAFFLFSGYKRAAANRAAALGALSGDMLCSFQKSAYRWKNCSNRAKNDRTLLAWLVAHTLIFFAFFSFSGFKRAK